jgi:hydroxyethylthiazole kinase-like uncharacterized protein yjeF
VRPVLSVSEMRRVDAEATTSVDVLMDRAGYAVAVRAAGMGAGYGSDVHVLCGRGNNGGDGWVAARYLRDRGAFVTVHHLGLPDPDTPARRAAHDALEAGVRIAPLSADPSGDLVIDAVFGTGFRGSLPDDVAAWTATSAPVLSVDIPSGVDGDSGAASGPVFRAASTVTFHALKPGHVLLDGPDVCGDVVVADIGLTGGDASLWKMEYEDLVINRRERLTHKWSAGAVATIGGVPGLTGAALLAARSAIAAGAGVSTILTTAATTDTYEALAPDIPTVQASETLTWQAHASEVLALPDRFDVLVVGPGLEPAPATFIERLLERFDGPMVVDAGAITVLADLDALSQRSAPTVLTPHAGEFKRFSGLAPTHESVKQIAASTGAIVLLKGSPTFVAGSRLVAIDRGGPELASIGTGDVLTGVIAALMATGVDPELAAASGAYLHGLAGATLAAERTVTAPLLVDAVAAIVADLTATGVGASGGRSTTV